MSYVTKVLQPGETVLAVGQRHWVVYIRGILLLVIAAAVFFFRPGNDTAAKAFTIVAAILALIGLYFVLTAWFDAHITEIAVTDRRIIYKRGLIQRETEEMNVDKVETVMVRQSVLGRILDYGNVDIRGTGEGIEDLRTISDPLRLRSAITTHVAPT